MTKLGDTKWDKENLPKKKRPAMRISKQWLSITKLDSKLGNLATTYSQSLKSGMVRVLDKYKDTFLSIVGVTASRTQEMTMKA